MNRIVRHWLPADERTRRALRRAAWPLAVLLGGLVVWLILARDWPGAAEKVLAKGRTPRIEIISLGLVWKALLVDAALLTGLLLAAPWWALPSKTADEDQKNTESPRHPSKQRRLIVIGTMLILAFALWLRLPRMTMSLYNDEAHNYARLWSGLWQPGPDGPVLDTPRWGETLFLNNAGNNSQPFSLAARGSLELARAAGWSVPGEVTEWAVRLPSLLAGLLTICLLGLVARAAGSQPSSSATEPVAPHRPAAPLSMIAVMLALTLHPWHIRYSTEARGYSFMLLGIALMLFFISRAFATNHWRHWLGYAAGLWLCATSFLGSIYFLVCLNAVLLLRQAWRWRQTGDATLLARPLVAGLLAAMAGLPLLLPVIPQLLKVLDSHDSIRGIMGAPWWRDVAGYLLAGARWGDGDPANPVNQALSRWIGAPGWTAALLCWLALLATGAVALWRRGGLPRVLLIATPAALLLAWFLMARQGNFLNHWYLLYAVPCVVLALGTGAAWWLQRSRTAGLLLTLAALLVPGRVALAYRGLEKQNERGPVLEALGAAYPGAGKTAPRPLLGAFWCNSNLYHPEIVVLRGETDLQTLIDRARRESRPLYVCHSHRPYALRHSPELMKRVEDTAEFEKIRVFHGQEESQSALHLFRLRE